MSKKNIAYTVIECDRCGDEEELNPSGETPPGWTHQTIQRNDALELFVDLCKDCSDQLMIFLDKRE